MTINPLQLIPQRLLPSAVAAKTGGAKGGAFETLLSSLDKAQDGSAPKGELAAAELLRMEMMQSSLSLFGDDQEQHPSGLQALETLLAQAAGNGSAGSGNVQASISSRPHPAAAAGKSAAAGGLGGDLSLLKELTSTEPVSTAAGSGIEKTAEQYLGIPYRFGGDNSTGIDCSSFVQHVFREHEIALPRTAREQIKVGSEVPQGELQKGDLVFFHTYASYPSHVGIYLGEGKMIHASSAKGEVTVSDMNTDYYRSRFIGAKRIA